MTAFKDDILGELAPRHNVAQFVSFAPSGEVRHVVLRQSPTATLQRDFIRILFEQADEHSVRVRTFLPGAPPGQPFTNKAIASSDEADQLVTKLRQDGLYVIVNESISINDGGISGVKHGNVTEFSPRAVPRCVDMPGVFSAELGLGIRVLRQLYGSQPALNDFTPSQRVEFSFHPVPRGRSQSNTIIWEAEALPSPPDTPAIPIWPNNLSRAMGDKTFGLLMAHLAGLPVPRTQVIPRWVPPFVFGEPTGLSSHWTRTCPTERQPGKFTTVEGWIDPFQLLAREDPDQELIASILYQDAVNPVYSGAGWIKGAQTLVEGVRGKGDRFMMGDRANEVLPSDVHEKVVAVLRRVRERFGASEIEWVFDGARAWIVQLHLASDAPVPEGWIFVGKASEFIEFDVARGLVDLRRMIDGLKAGVGVELVGDVGLTSHLCDLLRKHAIPSRLRRKLDSVRN